MTRDNIAREIDQALGLIESGMTVLDKRWKHLTEDEITLLEWSFERLAVDNVRRLRSAFAAMQEPTDA